MREHDNDKLEQFFRKATSKPDVSFNEDDWEKLEARLDARYPLKDEAVVANRPGRKVATASVVSAVLLLLLLFWVNSGDNLETVSEPVTSENEAPAARGPSTASAASDNIELNEPHRPGDEREEAAGSDGTAIGTGSKDDEYQRAQDALKSGLSEQHRVATTSGVTDNGDDDTANGIAESARGSIENDVTGRRGVVDAADERIFNDLIYISTATAGKNKQKAIVELPGAEEVETAKAESPVRAEHSSDKHDRVATSRLSLLLSFAPDFSSTSLSRYSAPGRAFGAVLQYHIKNRWRFSAGVVKNNKQYTGDGEDYSPPKGYWKYYTNGKVPNSIDGSCTVLEFPLMVQYTIINKPQNMLLVGAGASSYLMWNESYRYNFDGPNPGSKEGWDSEGRSSFMFNMVNFTVAYERQVLPGFRIGIEPYVKIPIEEIGWSNVRLFSTGASLTMRYTLLQKRNVSVPRRSRGPD